MKIHIQDPTLRHQSTDQISPSFLFLKQSIHGVAVTILVITQWYLSSNKCNIN